MVFTSPMLLVIMSDLDSIYDNNCRFFCLSLLSGEKNSITGCHQPHGRTLYLVSVKCKGETDLFHVVNTEKGPK